MQKVSRAPSTFCYLPVDFITKRTKGYGFVNFGAVEAAEDFVDKFHLHRLSRYPTKKILEVVPAITQGFEANVAQYTRKDRQHIQNRPLPTGSLIELIDA